MSRKLAVPKVTIFLSILLVIKALLLVLTAFITSTLINKALKKEELTVNIIILSLVIFSQIVIQIIYLHLKNHSSVKEEAKLKHTVFDSLLEKEVVSLDNYHSGELSNYYLVDVANINNGNLGLIPSICQVIAKVTLSFVGILFLDWKYILLIVVVMLGISIISCIIYKKLKYYERKALEEDGKINALMQENMQNIRIIKALDATKSASLKVLSKLDENKQIKTKKNNYLEIAQGGFTLAVNLFYLSTLIYALLAIKNGKMDYGSLYSMMQLVVILTNPLMLFSSYVNRFNQYKTSKTRISKLLELNDETPNEEIADFDSIVFENVCFNYEKEVIKDLNLVINKDDMLVIEGPSGSGKSTVLYLLLGFIKPQKGRIYVKKGDIEVTLSKSTRNLFTYVSQANILFRGTLFENIRFFNPNVMDSEIIEVLDAVNLKNEILKNYSHLDISLNEQGKGLSVGQIQRVLIAISILQNKKIMLLDEFNSALDYKNEQDIIKILIKLGKTIIFVSHHHLEVEGVKSVSL